MSRDGTSRRTRLIIFGVVLATATVLLGTMAIGVANTNPYEGADTIVLELEDGNNRFIYGDAGNPVGQQGIFTLKSNCSVSEVSSSYGEIMTLSASTYDRKGNPVESAFVGLVDDGLGVNETGKGNGQDCGLVDELSDGMSEALTLTLGTRIAGQLISSIDFDFEAKFDAMVEVEYLLGGIVLFTETPADGDPFDLSANGSDSGPDSKFLDKYYRTGPWNPDNQGKLFDGVTIRMTNGSVSLEGGDTWPDPSVKRTVFHLVNALDCGDTATSGGPGLADNPLAAFYVGPDSKDITPCAVPVSIVTLTSDGEQSVEVSPPSGSSWSNVTGVITVEWDEEGPSDAPVKRTKQEVIVNGNPKEIEVPWCEEAVDIVQAGGDFYYELSDPAALYPNATGTGDVCLIFQNTTTLDDGGVMFTQTTETFYVWNDPRFLR